MNAAMHEPTALAIQAGAVSFAMNDTDDPFSRPRPTLAIVLAFAGVYLIWGSTYLGIKLAVGSLPPLLMAGARFVIAGVILYAYARLRSAPRPGRREWINALVLGGLLLLGGNGTVTWASQSKMPTGLIALIIASTPIWAEMIAWLIFRMPRPSARVAGGLMLGFVGVVLLIGPARLTSAASEDLPKLELLVILLACVSWSFGTLLGKRLKQPDSMLLATAMQMLAGGTSMVIAGLVAGEWQRVHPENWTLVSGLAFVYLTLIGSLLAFTSYVYLIRHVSPAAATSNAYVNPVVAVFLGWLVLNERLEPMTWVGAALVLPAVILITTAPRAAAPKRGEPDIV
jgi:drug/metabolite transporter (DMT)-like permease